MISGGFDEHLSDIIKIIVLNIWIELELHLIYPIAIYGCGSISPTECFANWTFHQAGISLTIHFIDRAFHQPDISLT
jgi:hypothetical protein